MIRLATLNDRIPVLDLLSAAHSESSMFELFEFDAALVGRNMFDAHLQSEDSLVLVHDVDDVARGVLIARAQPYPYGDIKLGYEIAIWVDPQHRGSAWQKMRREYEAWAKGKGCNVVTFSGKKDPRFARLLERSGYAPVETQYLKAI